MAQRHVTSQALVRLLIGQLAHARGYKSMKRVIVAPAARVGLLLRCRASAGGTGRGRLAGLGAAEIWARGHWTRDLGLSFQR